MDQTHFPPEFHCSVSSCIVVMVFHGLLAAFSISVLSASGGYCASTTNLAWHGGLPTIQLDNGTFIGNQTGNVTQFLGIPYALPPYVFIILSYFVA